jgi:anti-sigma factor RsiW
MEAHHLTVLCVRSREWTSLALDGELSEFELHVMREHLRRCLSCAAFAADLDAITEAIRSAEAAPVASPVTLPQRRRVSAGMARVAAVAAVLVGAVGIAGSLTLPQDGPALPAVNPRQGPSDEMADRLIRSVKMQNVEALKTYPRGDFNGKLAGLPI